MKERDTVYLKALKNARRRCEEPTNNRYAYYGAKGIRCFLIPEDMLYLAKKYNANKMKKPQLHRKDGTKDYTLYNCVFIEASDHSRLTHTGAKRSLASRRRMSLAGGTRYGEQHGNAKLTYKNIESIRSSKLSCEQEARVYGVCKATISLIRRRITWLK